MQTMVPAGGDKIWAEGSGGDRPALLLLHEGVGDARMWDPIWPALIENFRAIRYDVRGFGRSPAATEEYTLLGDALTVLDHFGVAAAHLAGCSMGGATAMELTLAEPARAMSLVLLCPGVPGYPYPEDPELEARFDAAEAAGDIDGLVRLGLEQWGRSGDDPLVTDLMRSALRVWPSEERFEQRGEPVYDRLGELRAPVVVMVGDQDNPGGAHPRLRAHPDARCRPLPDGARAAARNGDDSAALRPLRRRSAARAHPRRAQGPSTPGPIALHLLAAGSQCVFGS